MKPTLFSQASLFYGSYLNHMASLQVFPIKSRATEKYRAELILFFITQCLTNTGS